jgi:type I restriction enzyme R subunit
MTPEAQARQVIDERLQAAGWLVQDYRQLNLGAGVGHSCARVPHRYRPGRLRALRQSHACGVIEAKKDGAGETSPLPKIKPSATPLANLKWRKANTPLRFLFEATGQIIRFTDNADPAPRSRELFHFFKPEELAEWLVQPDTLRRRLVHSLPRCPSATCATAKSAPSPVWKNHWH